MTLKWIAVVGAIILAFLFPAELIDAIKNEDKDRKYRGRACACFGFLIMFMILLIRS